MTPAVLSLAAAALLAAAPPGGPGASGAAGARERSGDGAATSAGADAPAPSASGSSGAVGADAGDDPTSPPSPAGPYEPPATQAGAPAAQAGAAEAAARPPGGRSWFVLPVAFWLPETKLGGAVAAGIHFHAGKGAGDSNAFLVAGYTMLGQGTVDLDSDVVLKGGTLLTGRLRAAYYPDFFYGIGPTTSVDQKESQTRRFAEAIFTAELPVVRGLRAGPRVHARAERISDATPGGLVAAGRVPGATGFDALGLGVQATWDSRDHPLWTTRGAFVETWYLRYPASLGRDSGFYRGSAEARYFAPLGHGRVLGFAALLEHADSGTPFSILPKIGSTRYLRGIRDGRYRDAIAWAAQAELRVPFRDKFAAALFGAFGDVTPSLAAQRADTLKVAGGAGLRYRLTDQGANIRVDAALSESGLEFYVLLLEAF